MYPDTRGPYVQLVFLNPVQTFKIGRRQHHIPQGLKTTAQKRRSKNCCRSASVTLPDSPSNARPIRKQTLIHTVGPDYAFPHIYPPLVRPESAAFVTQFPRATGELKSVPTTAFDDELEACTAAFSRLSLESSRHSKRPRKTSRAESKPRQYVSVLSPSRPRLVQPTLDTSVAVPYKPLPKHISSYPPPTNITHSQNIDIPRSRKACSIPYRRPTMDTSTPLEPPSTSSFSRGMRRTPSLISDHGSEASSPSTPPDFSPIHTPAPTLSHKGSSPETISPPGHSPVRYYEGGYDVDFGTDIYG